MCTVRLKPAADTTTVALPEPSAAEVVTQPVSPGESDEHEGELTPDATALPL
jgi:hypothetical protein